MVRTKLSFQTNSLSVIFCALAVFVIIMSQAISSHVVMAQGGWRLLRTPGPSRSGETLSMNRTADTRRSDADFAGMALRCGEHGVEPLIILVRPFPPRATPRVLIGGSSARTEFQGSTVPPGAAVKLPDAALALIRTSDWSELTVQVEEGGISIKGTVPIDGLGAALDALNSTCPPP